MGLGAASKQSGPCGSEHPDQQLCSSRCPGRSSNPRAQSPQTQGQSGRRGRVQQQEVGASERRVGDQGNGNSTLGEGKEEGRGGTGSTGEGWTQSLAPTGAPRGGVDTGAIYLEARLRRPGRAGGRGDGGGGVRFAGTGCRCGAPAPAGAPRGSRVKPTSGRRGQRVAGASSVRPGGSRRGAPSTDAAGCAGTGAGAPPCACRRAFWALVRGTRLAERQAHSEQCPWPRRSQAVAPDVAAEGPWMLAGGRQRRGRVGGQTLSQAGARAPPGAAR